MGRRPASVLRDYISKDDVKVFLDDTQVNEGLAANEWQWDGDKKIKMGTGSSSGHEINDPGGDPGKQADRPVD